MAEICTEDQSVPDALLQRHKQQRKELQAKIMNLKHSIPKGDKKKKREVLELVAKLEAELDESQAKEIANSMEMLNDMVKETVQDITQLSLSVPANEDPKGSRVSKAQKRRDKKAEKERQRALDIDEQEKINMLGARHLEAEKLKSILKERCLKIHEIPSDGDCMYAAVIHQLSTLNISLSVNHLRKQIADFLRSHTEDFFPFLYAQDNGDMFTEEKYATYCDNIESTCAWGGHIELRAVSHILKRPIEVLQADGPTITLGEEYTGEPLIVIYHRHTYSLGEHYNSVVIVEENSSEDGFT